jgi:DNA-binding PadR family transcriptional regulator
MSRKGASGRWSDPELLVLTSLAGGPKHGYAIVADVREMTGLRLGAGTLYGALARLEEQKLIEPLPASGRRRPYAITSGGRETLAARLETVAAVAEHGLARMRTVPGMG